MRQPSLLTYVVTYLLAMRPGDWGHAWRAHADSQGMCACPAKLKCGGGGGSGGGGGGESDLSLAQYGRAIRGETLRLFEVASVGDSFI